MSQSVLKPGTPNQAESQGDEGGRLTPRPFGQTLVGAAIFCLSLVWFVLFAFSLAHMPDAATVANAPEIVVTARYLPSGKSRLEFEKPDGDFQRHYCDPASRLCRFVVKNSPVELTVQLAGPDSGMSDQAVLFARAGNEVLVTPAEGSENFASLKSIYRNGLIGSLVGLVVGGVVLRRKRA